MNVTSLYEHRVQLIGMLLATGLALWILFGRAPQPSIISGWSGDARAAQNAAAQAAPAAAAPPAAEPKVAAAPAVPDATGGLLSGDQPQDQPWGNPFGGAQVVMTQGYGVGTHAPPERKGGIDLAVDGDGDGRSDPSVTMGSPLYATVSGVIEAKANTWPAGNHIWIKNDHYKVGYAHMLTFAVKNGQTVKRGDLIGYAGSTGKSTGPHLHYHIWKDAVNVNPLNYGALPDHTP